MSSHELASFFLLIVLALQVTIKLIESVKIKHHVHDTIFSLIENENSISFFDFNQWKHLYFVNLFFWDTHVNLVWTHSHGHYNLEKYILPSSMVSWITEFIFEWPAGRGVVGVHAPIRTHVTREVQIDFAIFLLIKDSCINFTHFPSPKFRWREKRQVKTSKNGM